MSVLVLFFFAYKFITIKPVEVSETVTKVVVKLKTTNGKVPNGLETGLLTIFAVMVNPLTGLDDEEARVLSFLTRLHRLSNSSNN